MVAELGIEPWIIARDAKLATNAIDYFTRSLRFLVDDPPDWLTSALDLL